MEQPTTQMPQVNCCRVESFYFPDDVDDMWKRLRKPKFGEVSTVTVD
jgi:hypothetical protein